MTHVTPTMLKLVVLCACAVVLGAGRGVDAAACASVSGQILGNGNDIGQSTESSSAACCSACQANPKCKAWTWHSDGSNKCWQHSAATPWKSEAGVISGVPSGPLPPKPTPPGTGAGYGCNSSAAASFLFCDTTKTIDERVEDLLRRISVDQLGSQLTARQSDAIDSLTVPSYYWGTNAIHGMQNVECLSDTGPCPTSFPAPCSLASTWNYSRVSDMGRVIGRELRAYFNGGVHNSLDTWSPTININRDPRWGRNVEAVSEDPMLSGDYGAAYTRGLQQRVPGQDLVQAVVTIKHFVAYSIESYNGVTRHTVDANVSAYDLANTYFPGWQAVVKQGALGIMCSYNELNHRPTCGNPALNATLREDWGFDGYITSDSDACGDIARSHHYSPDAPHAAAVCISGGTDINSGGTYRGNLASAVNGSLIPRSAVDDALRNAYRMRFRMGLFDPKVDNPYRHIPTSIVGEAASQEMSLASAREGMILLRNNNNLLPLKKGTRIALVGQAVDDYKSLTGNYDGPLCPTSNANCWPSIADEVSRINNASGGTTASTRKLDPASVNATIQGADTVIVVVDNARDGGGEGHDRYTISLSSDQIAMVQQVVASGKPTALVMVNGGIIAMDELAFQVDGLVEAFMPGVHGAQAIAETVFGDVNPGGKLPVTMYWSNYTNETDFLSMSMTDGPGRGYRYYNGSVMFPFAFGISYTTFTLKWSPHPPAVALVGPLGNVTYQVTVTNTGTVAGDEVVFVFIRPGRASAYPTLPRGTPVELKRLAAYQRVHLAAGASTTITFDVPGAAFALVDSDGHRSLHPGAFDVAVSRGHGPELAAQARVRTADSAPHRLSTFRKWW